MERKEAYEQIKKLGLQEVCKKMYGKNFTQCKTNELEKIINKAKAKVEVKINNKTNTISVITKPTIKTCDTNKDTSNIKESKRPFDKLLNILRDRHILLESDIKMILGE